MSGTPGGVCEVPSFFECLPGNDKLTPYKRDRGATMYSRTSDADRVADQIARYRAIDPAEQFCFFPAGKCRVALDEETIKTCDKAYPGGTFRDKMQGSGEVTEIIQVDRYRRVTLHSARYETNETKVQKMQDIVTIGLPKMAEAGLVYMNISDKTLMCDVYSVDDDTDIEYGTWHLFKYDDSRSFNDIRVNSEQMKWSRTLPPEYNALQEQRYVIGDRNAEFFETLGISSHDGDVYKAENARVYSKFTWEWSKLLATGKSPEYLGRLLLFDKIDVYGMGLVVANLLKEVVYRGQRVPIWKEQTDKALIWVANVTRANPLLRWSPSISAEYWPCIFDYDVRLAAAAELAKDLSRREADRVRNIIDTYVYENASEAGAGTSGGAAADSKAAGGRAYKRKSKSRSKRKRSTSIKRKKSPRRTVRRH